MQSLLAFLRLLLVPLTISLICGVVAAFLELDHIFQGLDLVRVVFVTQAEWALLMTLFLVQPIFRYQARRQRMSLGTWLFAWTLVFLPVLLRSWLLLLTAVLVAWGLWLLYYGRSEAVDDEAPPQT